MTDAHELDWGRIFRTAAMMYLIVTIATFPQRNFVINVLSFFYAVLWHFIFIFSVFVVFAMLYSSGDYVLASRLVASGLVLGGRNGFGTDCSSSLCRFALLIFFATIDLLRGLWTVFFVSHIYLACCMVCLSGHFWSWWQYFVKRSSDLWNSLLCNFIQPSATSFLLGRNMLLTNLFSNTCIAGKQH